MFYETTCPPDNEKKVAQALYAGPHPAAVLNDLITTWVQEYVRSKHISLIQSYFQAKNDLEKYVGDKAMEVVGLTSSRPGDSGVSRRSDGQGLFPRAGQRLQH